MAELVCREYKRTGKRDWALFKKKDLPKNHGGIVHFGEAKPVLLGCTKETAPVYKKYLQNSVKGE